MATMSMPSRIATGIASLALIATYFLPVWFIFLVAPQYPEGLTMNIWLNKLTGQVEIINGLNHYIGMKHISAEMFPELKFLVYIVAFFIAFGLVVAITGKRSLLKIYVVLTIIGGIAAMYDFYQWGYEYGHNLDPKAAIQVPGLSYQPPLIGHKLLLNFDAYSYPDTGGWVVFGTGMTFFLALCYELFRQYRHRTTVREASYKGAGVVVLFSCFFISCTSKPEPIQYGKDMCSHCRMTIMDPKFGAEVITNKGKIYKFDDARCIIGFLRAGTIQEKDAGQIVFNDYNNNQQFIDAATAFFVVSPKLKSPMNGNAAAFANREQASAKLSETGGQLLTWDNLRQLNQTQ